MQQDAAAGVGCTPALITLPVIPSKGMAIKKGCHPTALFYPVKFVTYLLAIHVC
jgi:hypothetical protein